MSAGLLDPDDWLQEPEGKDHGLDYLRMDDMKLLFHWRGAFHLRFYYMPNEVNRELTPPDGTGLPLVNRNAVSFLGRIPSPSDLMGTPQLPRVDGIKAGFPGRSGNRFGSVPSVEVPKHLVDNKEELEHYLPINFSSGDRHTLSSVAHENWRWHHSAPNPFADLKVDDQGNLVNPALAQRVTPQWPSWSVSDDYTDVVFVMKREGNPFWPVQRGESEFRG
ncbi:hypothetical protein JCM11641_004870 [Rhodosporidiobolus odoratus]